MSEGEKRPNDVPDAEPEPPASERQLAVPTDPGLESIENQESSAVVPQNPGFGWWLASDGQWYPPESRSEALVRKTADERKALLAQNVGSHVARGGRVDSQSEFQAVVVFGKPVNHVLHAILTIFTCLTWGVVWIVLAINGGEKRYLLLVDEYGNVMVQSV